jgi:hypothetical protein
MRLPVLAYIKTLPIHMERLRKTNAFKYLFLYFWCRFVLKRRVQEARSYKKDTSRLLSSVFLSNYMKKPTDFEWSHDIIF